MNSVDCVNKCKVSKWMNDVANKETITKWQSHGHMSVLNEGKDDQIFYDVIGISVKIHLLLKMTIDLVICFVCCFFQIFSLIFLCISVNEFPCDKMHNKCSVFIVLFFRIYVSCPPEPHFFGPGGNSGLPRSLPRNFIPITLSIFPNIALFGIPRPAS